MHENEIDVKEFFNVLLRNKKFLIGYIGLLLMACITYNELSPQKYTTSCSFFLKKQSGQTISSGYARLLQLSAPSNLNSYVTSVIESTRLHNLINADIRLLFPANPQKLHLIQSIVLENSLNGLYSLSFTHPNQEISFEVIKSTLKNLKTVIIDLNVTGQKEILTLLDKAEKPKKPSYPRKKINLLATGILAVFSGVFIVFFKETFLS